MPKDIIPIVTVSSKAFLKYALVMIWSVMSCGRKDQYYVFHIFHNEITTWHQKWLREQLSVWENCRIEFLDIRILENDFGLADTDWSGKTSCFSLFCVDFLKQYDKVLALDADLVARRDVADLYKMELSGAWLAGVYDLDFAGQWHKKNRDYQNYYTVQVPLMTPECYIQAGVLLLDLCAFRKQFPPGFLVKVASEKKFRFDDQDIWNLYCAGHIKQLDYRWNVMHDNCGYRIRHVIEFAPQKAEYFSSRKDPFIIHYAGEQKPWNAAECDLGEAFWTIANQTPVCQELVAAANRPYKKKKFGIVRTGYHELCRMCTKLSLIAENLRT